MSANKPLQGFAAPGSSGLTSGKPAKPFGAPDSDAEDEDKDDEEDDDAAPPDGPERALSPEKEPDEKKKTKLHKVEVDHGETGEATIVSVRAKMFYHDKEAGWKERGAGMLKINVPEDCIDFDGDGAAVPGTFDASTLEPAVEENGSSTYRTPRLLMRQDQTHRVILNTSILPGMVFQEKTSLKSVGVIFTAFEGESAQPVTVTMRMSVANAKNFMNEVETIQRELRG